MPASALAGMSLFGDPAKLMEAQDADVGRGARYLAAGAEAGGREGQEKSALAEKADKDRRFAAPEWRDNPLFDTIRQTYLLVSDRLLGSVDAIEGVDAATREKMRFTTKAFVDAMSPSNFALTNPQVLEKAMETKGESLLHGLEHMLKDMEKGQLTHVQPGAFEVGRNIATTPGKVIKQTALYQLIQYAPATDRVLAAPLIIFPPWINRFYILDLNPEKSFIKWAVGQGLTVFVVSWKSADESMKDVKLDDYALAQVEAIDAVREALGVEAVHAIGYCVAGTMLAATLALLEARGEAGKVASATFFTAQVDFSESGDLKLFIGDEQMELIRQLSADKGYLDGRYMAATFNLLSGRDLIWSYVTNNYLLGQDYPQFDLLHWNSRHDQFAGGLAPRLSPAALPREQIGPAGRDQGRRRADRPQDGEDPHLCPGRARGPYRAAAERVEDHPPFHRTDALRAGGLGPHRRRGQSAGGAEIPILDQRGQGRHARRVHRRRDRDQGELVARLDPMDPRHFERGGARHARAGARQGAAQGDRGRARKLCEGAVSWRRAAINP